MQVVGRADEAHTSTKRWRWAGEMGPSSLKKERLGFTLAVHARGRVTAVREVSEAPHVSEKYHTGTRFLAMVAAPSECYAVQISASMNGCGYAGRAFIMAYGLDRSDAA